jgi:hypothetical protein
MLFWSPPALAEDSEPVSLSMDESAAPWSEPLRGSLTRGDVHDIDGPWDWYVVRTPPGTWVDVTLTDFSFAPRLTVGRETDGYGRYAEPPLTLSGLSTGELTFGIGGNGSDGTDYGRYAFQVALRRPDASEPPLAPIPSVVTLGAEARPINGWYCHLVTVSYRAEISATADRVEPRVLAGRWVDGALVIDRTSTSPRDGYSGGSTGSITASLTADGRGVVGICADRFGEVRVDQPRRATQTVAAAPPPEPVVSAASERQEASRALLHALAEDLAADARTWGYTSSMATGVASREDPLVVEVWRQKSLPRSYTYQVLSTRPLAEVRCTLDGADLPLAVEQVPAPERGGRPVRMFIGKVEVSTGWQPAPLRFACFDPYADGYDVVLQVLIPSA